MTTTPWTIDDGNLLWWTDDVGEWTLLTATEVGEAAYEALVAAVRDADTLTQARRLATKVQTIRYRWPMSTDDKHVLTALVELLRVEEL